LKWPNYVIRQRKRKILKSRLRVPPTINQFTHTLDKNAATELFTLLNAHRPETPKEKKARLLAASQKKDAQADTAKPTTVKFGLKHVTALIESKKAKLVVIAHDVDPIELVVWLPTLCRKKGIPYVIVKGKARLGTVVHKKTATALAFVTVRPQDKTSFTNLVGIAKENFNDKYVDRMKQPGGGVLSRKQRQINARQEKIKRSQTKAVPQ